jgi:hypothetical protein
MGKRIASSEAHEAGLKHRKDPEADKALLRKLLETYAPPDEDQSKWSVSYVSRGDMYFRHDDLGLKRSKKELIQHFAQKMKPIVPATAPLATVLKKKSKYSKRRRPRKQPFPKRRTSVPVR